jgi:hypothetical protein
MTDTTPNERQLAADLVAVLQGIARADAANTGELIACAHRVGRHAARLIVMQYAKTPGQFLWIAETRTDWLAAIAAEVSAYLETAAENAEAVAAAGEVTMFTPKPWPAFPSDPQPAHEGNGWDDIDTSGSEVVL